ncbi:hypothetical protein LENED_012040 [Lentinula edodes]|uniref:Uncharacterized protein n=1 Tax=Lentinula edodes TaxID=5353 RepID=A0A1Q3ERL1_LENED|nr:hypothetical protein LENED_012040 [Lentinula edodes]
MPAKDSQVDLGTLETWRNTEEHGDKVRRSIKERTEKFVKIIYSSHFLSLNFIRIVGFHFISVKSVNFS